MSSLLGSIIPDEWFSVIAFVEQANLLLPRFLPSSSSDSRQREEVNLRLVRHMTTLGLLDEALREGREARYTGTHLLQLLVVRRLMAEGYTTGAIKKLIAGASVERLEAILEGEAQPTVEVFSPPALSGPPIAPGAASGMASSPNAALDYLHNLRQRKKSSSDNKAALTRGHSPSAPDASSVPVRPPAPAAAPDAIVSSHQSTSSQSGRPLRWTRVEILPGLEVHMREDFALPTTPYEQERLLQRAVEELKAIQAEGTAATRRRTS